MRRALLALVILLAVGPAFGQSAPVLTVEEDLRWQVLQLRVQLETAIAQGQACQGQLGQWRAQAMSGRLTADEAALKGAVEAAHPGTVWDPKTGAFSAGGLAPTVSADHPEGRP